MDIRVVEKDEYALATQATEEMDLFLDALDEMQEIFMEIFRDRVDFLDAHHWNVCKKLWRLRYDDEPIKKEQAISWRKEANIGENRARDHIDAMIKFEFLEEYFIPEISKRIKFVKPTDKFFQSMHRILEAGVQAMKSKLC